MKIFAFLASCLLAFNAHATVSAISKIGDFFTKPFNQTRSACMRTFMIAEYGIPMGSLMEGIFADTLVLDQFLGGTSTFKNINLLSANGTVGYNLVSDDYINDIWSYRFNLDFAQISVAKRALPSGRQKTIDTAKLAIISIVKTAILNHGPAKFKIWLKINNLPDQTGLSGNCGIRHHQLIIYLW